MKTAHPTFLLYICWCFISMLIAIESTAGEVHECRAIVTVSDYTIFLNTAAASDPNHLYDKAMGGSYSTASIIRGGSPGKYYYQTVAGCENDPITYVDGFNASYYTAWKGGDGMVLANNDLNDDLKSNKSELLIVPRLEELSLAHSQADSFKKSHWSEALLGSLAILGMSSFGSVGMLEEGRSDAAPTQRGNSLRSDDLTLNNINAAIEAHPDATRLVCNREGTIHHSDPDSEDTNENREQNRNMTNLLKGILKKNHSETLVARCFDDIDETADWSSKKVISLFQQASEILKISSVSRDTSVIASQAYQGGWFDGRVTEQVDAKYQKKIRQIENITNFKKRLISLDNHLNKQKELSRQLKERAFQAHQQKDEQRSQLLYYLAWQTDKNVEQYLESANSFSTSIRDSKRAAYRDRNIDIQTDSIIKQIELAQNLIRDVRKENSFLGTMVVWSSLLEKGSDFTKDSLDSWDLLVAAKILEKNARKLEAVLTGAQEKQDKVLHATSWKLQSIARAVARYALWASNSEEATLVRSAIEGVARSAVEDNQCQAIGYYQLETKKASIVEESERARVFSEIASRGLDQGNIKDALDAAYLEPVYLDISLDHKINTVKDSNRWVKEWVLKRAQEALSNIRCIIQEVRMAKEKFNDDHFSLIENYLSKTEELLSSLNKTLKEKLATSSMRHSLAETIEEFVPSKPIGGPLPSSFSGIAEFSNTMSGERMKGDLTHIKSAITRAKEAQTATLEARSETWPCSEKISPNIHERERRAWDEIIESKKEILEILKHKKDDVFQEYLKADISWAEAEKKSCDTSFLREEALCNSKLGFNNDSRLKRSIDVFPTWGDASEECMITEQVWSQVAQDKERASEVTSDQNLKNSLIAESLFAQAQSSRWHARGISDNELCSRLVLEPHRLIEGEVWDSSIKNFEEVSSLYQKVIDFLKKNQVTTHQETHSSIWTIEEIKRKAIQQAFINFGESLWIDAWRCSKIADDARHDAVSSGTERGWDNAVEKATSADDAWLRTIEYFEKYKDSSDLVWIANYQMLLTQNKERAPLSSWVTAERATALAKLSLGKGGFMFGSKHTENKAMITSAVANEAWKEVVSIYDEGRNNVNEKQRTEWGDRLNKAILQEMQVIDLSIIQEEEPSRGFRQSDISRSNEKIKHVKNAIKTALERWNAFKEEVNEAMGNSKDSWEITIAAADASQIIESAYLIMKNYADQEKGDYLLQDGYMAAHNINTLLNMMAKVAFWASYQREAAVIKDVIERIVSTSIEEAIDAKNNEFDVEEAVKDEIKSDASASTWDARWNNTWDLARAKIGDTKTSSRVWQASNNAVRSAVRVVVREAVRASARNAVRDAINEVTERINIEPDRWVDHWISHYPINKANKVIEESCRVSETLETKRKPVSSIFSAQIENIFQATNEAVELTKKLCCYIKENLMADRIITPIDHQSSEYLESKIPNRKKQSVKDSAMTRSQAIPDDLSGLSITLPSKLLPMDVKRNESEDEWFHDSVSPVCAIAPN